MKSRIRNPHINNQGGYMIFDPYYNVVRWGEKFDLTLDDVEEILAAIGLCWPPGVPTERRRRR